MFRRLFAVYGTLFAATLAVLAASTVRHSGEFEQRRLEESMVARAEMIADAVHGLDRPQLQPAITRLAARQPDALRITLLDAGGVVLADTDRDSDVLENHARRPEILTASEAPYGTNLRHSNSVG